MLSFLLVNYIDDILYEFSGYYNNSFYTNSYCD